MDITYTAINGLFYRMDSPQNTSILIKLSSYRLTNDCRNAPKLLHISTMENNKSLKLLNKHKSIHLVIQMIRFSNLFHRALVKSCRQVKCLG